MRPTADQMVLDGRYRLGKVLGRGGMGEVRAAEDLRLGRPVAVKLLRADLADDADLRRRFESEARAAAGISHPHAVAVYDAGEDEGVAYLVMERLAGDTLADEMAAGPLDQDRACAVASQVLGALGAAHDRGLIHRDIKPGNVLVTANGAAKLADFGIAKVMESSDDATTGFLLGTPAYLAPERLAGHSATPESDLYALGVVLYEALTGRKPFVGDTPFAVIHAIHQGEPEPLGVLRPDVRPAVLAAVEQAMHADPARRFHSAAALARALSGDATMVAPAAGADWAAGEGAEVTVSLPPKSTVGLDQPTPSIARRRMSSFSPVGPSRRVVVAFGAVVMLVIALFTIWPRDDSPPTAQTPPTTAAPGPRLLPEPLDKALEKLEESVNP